MTAWDAVRRAVATHPRSRGFAGAVVDRLVAVSRTAPPGLRGAPPGAGEADVQTVVVALAGADDDVVATTLADLEAMAHRHGALRVVLAVEGRHLSAVRRGGLPAEHLLSHQDWRGRPREQTWGEYLRERLDTMRSDYAAVAVVVLGPCGTLGLSADLVVAALPAPRGGSIRRRWRARVTALERALDAPAP